MKKTTRRRIASSQRGLRLRPETIRTLSSSDLTHAIAGNKQVTCDTTSLTTENSTGGCTFTQNCG